VSLANTITGRNSVVGQNADEIGQQIIEIESKLQLGVIRAQRLREK
jgi:hypothetical protein